MMRRHALRGLLVLSIVSLALFGCEGGEEAKQPGEGGPTVPPRGTITLEATVESMPADGASTSDIQATVRDVNSDLVADGTTVTFEIISGPLDPGRLSADSATTAAGQVQITYTAGTLEGSVQIRASAEVDGETVSSVISLTLQGVVITLTADPPAVQAGGDQSDITAQVRYSGGNPVPQGTVVAFETTLGILSAPQALTNQTGVATVTLTSSALPGTATVTATALDASEDVDVNFTELPPTVSTIELSTLQSPEVGVLGSWEPQTSEIEFLARDKFGDPVGAGYSIEFDILSGPDEGEQMFPSVAQTSSSGIASAVFTAGIKSGTVRVVARYRDNPTVVSNAVVITIHGGLPDGPSFGVWAELLNIAGLRFHGLTDPVHSCPSDSMENDVPNGTALYFTTNYGNINAAITTDGGCGDSELRSQNPRPPDGFVTYEASTQSGILSKILSITPDPTDAGTIWVGTDGHGIYRTINGGSNWLHVGDFSNGLTNGIIRDIALDGPDNNIVYAGTHGGVFKSVGGGAWEDLTGWKRITGEYLGNGAAANLDGASPSYALQYASTMQRARTRVYVNGVETIDYFYTSASSIRMIGSLNGADVITMDYDLDLEFPTQFPVNAIAIDTDVGDPLDSSTIYAGTGGGGVYKSEDGGFTWVAVNRGLSNQVVLCLILDAAGANLYAGTSGGVFRSQDGGAIWTRHVDGLTDWAVQTLVEAGGRLVAGTATRGIFWTGDIDSGWTEAATNVNAEKSTNGEVTDIVAQSSSVLYASTREGGVFRSSDSASSWTPRTNVFGESLGTADGVTYIFPMSSASNQDKPSTRVYVGSQDLPYGAYNFQGAQAITLFDPPAAGQAISADYVIAGYPSAYTYALGVTAANVIFAGGNGRNLISSTDAGMSWSDSNGIGIDRIENDVFATAKTVFTGGTVVRILSLLIFNPDHLFGPDDDFGIRLEGTNYGASYPVEHGGYEVYFITISDSNGNPLVGGSSFTLEEDCGSDIITLTGDLGYTIQDALRGQTDYAFTAANNNIGDESEVCTFTLSVTSETDALDQAANGSPGDIAFSQEFWAKLKVEPGEAGIKPDESQRLTGTGGSGSYEWTAPGAAITSGTGETFLFIPTGIGNYIVTVRDRRTGETAQSYITVKADDA